MDLIITLISKICYFLWGDWIHIPLPGSGTLDSAVARADISTGRCIFHDKDRLSADTHVSRHAAGGARTRRRE